MMKKLTIGLILLGTLAVLTSRSIIAAEVKLKKIAVKEVIKHNSEKSCWMVIDKKVYDITSYITKHPTPPQILIKYCGKDGSKGYKTKGLGRPHSKEANKMLEKYLIGELDV